MSKKILIGGGMALVALVVAVASMLLFAKVQPTEAEVRAAVEMALPDGAVVDQMTFAVFSDDRSKGRVSVKGTYSFSNDIYSLPTPPVELMRSLASAQIFDTDVARWWSENSSFYPQFKGKLGEFQKIYTIGESLEFAGELPFLAVVDGTKVDSTSLDYTKRDGTLEPEFGYADDAEQISELTVTIVEWRDRRREEAAVAEAARIAEAEAAAAVAAKQAEERAAAAAKAAEADAAARARAAEIEAEAAIKAAAAQAAAEEEARIAAERAREEARRPAESGPCLRVNTDKLNCTTVTFGPGPDTYYDRQAPIGHCILPDVAPSSDPDSEGFRKIALGGGQYRYFGPAGLTVQFFDLRPGESYKGGKPCK